MINLKRLMNRLLLLCFIFKALSLYSYQIEGGVVLRTTPPFMQKDSLLYEEYNKLDKLEREGHEKEALKVGLVLVDRAINKKDYFLAARSNFIVGKIFSKARDYDKSIESYRKSLELISSMIDYGDFTKRNAELIYFRKQSYLKIGTQYFKMHLSLKVKRYKDSFLRYNKLVVDSDTFENKELLNLKAKAYSNLAGVFAQDSLYSMAEKYANEAIKIHRRQNDKLSEAAALSNLANIFIYQKHYKKAKQLYSRGLKLIENRKSIQAIEFKESLYENLGYAMYMLKDYKAYEIQDLSYEIKDSLRDIDVRRMIEEVNAEYNVDNVRQAEELKRIKIESEKEASQKNTWLVGAMGLITALLLLYIANYYKLRQQKLSLELSNTEFMQREKLDKLKAESQLKMLNATLDGKEEERKEIAETLHDNVSALLSSANLHLQASQKQFNGNTPVEIEKTQKIILEASQKVRDLSHTLVSSILLKFGLAYAIKDMANKYTNSMLSIHVDFNTINRYTQKLEIKIYNIIQELVNNIIKHSKASNACVLLKESGETLHITIRDNGCGFDASAYNTDDIGHVKSGIGLNQIRARVQIMKGTFKINSKLGKGTEMVIILPIKFRESFTRA
ncbi:ATP-binding protein [Tenacibaculum maritimum]|uniref:ATP-binding protein n=2 Tax=Tenacibaculum maritimum TaxID=107401 RepID=UPI0038769A6D